MEKKYRGLMHVHSSYSFDGTMRLEELASECRSRKLDYIALTEHADAKHFSEEKMISFVKECERSSSEAFLMVPGLEYDCEGMHILAIGIKNYFIEKDLGSLIEGIHKRGGLAVLAHVSYYDRIPYDELAGLDGVEAWNSRYDSRFSPSRKSLNILSRFREKKKDMPAYAGLDLHARRSFGGITTTIKANKLSSEELVKSLREKKFYSTNNLIKFFPTNDPGSAKRFFFIATNAAYQIVKKLSRGGSRILYKAGIKPVKDRSA
jgi:predicted metal-dependent phosphoesterase TrpH